MKKILLFVLFASIISCNSDDGFKDANGNAAKRYLTKATTNGTNFSNVSTVTYDANKKVLTASDGETIKSFIYTNNGDLDRIVGGGESLFSSEVLGVIHDAYEIGKVLQYDSKGNPTVLELIDYDDYYGEMNIYTATISYDDKPFMFYYTMEAAGIVKVLKDTRLNFSSVPSSPQIVMAKMLLPVNNPIRAIIRDDNNVEKARVDVTYSYDSTNYPTSSNVVSNSGNEVNQYTVNYEYLP